jgi:Cdc6-like AAA superfamily ATPase
MAHPSQEINPDPEKDASKSKKESTLDELDKLISRFSDDASHEKTETKNSGEESIIRMFSPPGLEEAFKQLHSILVPCLLSRSALSEQKISSTASAILMGPRGSGKSLLLNSCLKAYQYQNPDATKFRQVTVNGIVCRGSDVSAVVFEIIRQLSDLAFHEGKQQNGDTEENDNKEQQQASSKRRRLDEHNEMHLLRLRKSNFTSNLALLESTLKMAAIDKIPILLVLDELDCFTAQDERQVLLYHLLDRVATPGSSLCLVGITSSFTTLQSLEKRIRSRAEGVSRVIYTHPPNTYDKLVDIVRHKLDGSKVLVVSALLNIIQKPALTSNADDESHKIHTKLWSTMEREFRFGKDLRWFSRVLSTALALYSHDVDMEDNVPEFKPSHLLDALVMLRASISDDTSASVTNHPNLCMIQDQAVDPRLQALLDMSKPQVALLLAARRILTREAHREQAVTAPLTLQRMMKEYESSFRRLASQRKESTLLPAARQLLERGILVPSTDHSGGGPLQYSITQVYKTLDPYSLVRLPLHMPVDIDRELGEALDRNLLDCSTALREWGRKIN